MRKPRNTCRQFTCTRGMVVSKLWQKGCQISSCVVYNLILRWKEMAQASYTIRYLFRLTQQGIVMQMRLRSSNRRRSGRKKACWAALKSIQVPMMNLSGSKVQHLLLLIVNMALVKILCRLMEIRQAPSIAKTLLRSWLLKENHLLLLASSPSRHSVVLQIAVMEMK